jgi:hypothetical protein
MDFALACGEYMATVHTGFADPGQDRGVANLGSLNQDLKTIKI